MKWETLVIILLFPTLIAIAGWFVIAVVLILVTLEHIWKKWVAWAEAE